MFLDHHTYFIEDQLGSKKNYSNISKEEYELFILHISISHNKNWNYTNPYSSFSITLFDIKLRITLIHKAISGKDATQLYIRKLNHRVFNLSSFGQNQDLLKKLVSEKKNILVCGSTGSGKTSLLNSLIQHIPDTEHIILIEDTDELIKDKSHITSLLVKNDNQSMSEFCKYSLRMNPNRIILGEIRSTEVIPLILMMNNGHKGVMSTIHASSAQDGILRLAYLMSIYATNINTNLDGLLKIITNSFDYIIYIQDKKIEEVSQIKGCENQQIYLSPP